MSTKHRTVLGFNPKHKLHYNTINVDHPENPNRIDEIEKRLDKIGLLNQCEVLTSFPPIESNLLEKVHSIDNLSRLQRLNSMEQEEINKYVQEFDSVNMTKDSFDAALEAANCAVHLTKLLVEGKADNGFALIRPPGHHAQHSFPNGFCLLNNVCLAAKQAEAMGIERTLIVDWDVHHGQGTQYQFYESKNVLYFSTHRYERGAFWPHLRESNYDFVGAHDGKAFNVNVPFNETGVEDADFMHTFWSILYPIACEFKPQLILYSAGFDSCRGDPVGQFNLTPNLYAQWLYHLQTICPKQLLLLEGGYNHRVQAVCVQRCVEVLLGAIPKFKLENEWRVRQSTIETCNNLLHALHSYWPSLEQNKSFNPNTKSSYKLSTDLPANTADIHQHELPFPFGGKEFETRLNELKIDVFAQNDNQMEVSSQFDSLIKSTKLNMHITNGLEDFENTSNPTGISIIVSSQFDSAIKQSDKVVLKIEQQTRNGAPLFQLTVKHKTSNDRDQVFDALTTNAAVLKIYKLLPKLQSAICFIQIDQHGNKTIWQLAWHLHSIQQLNVVVLCKDFDPIEEEVKRSINLFNEYK